MTGMTIQAKNGVNGAVSAVLKSLKDSGCVDAVLVPTRVRSGESFVYLLVKDPKLLDSCTPLPPIMPVQGARALQSLTRHGKVEQKVLCVMRPCEVRASIELAKRRQVDLENILFASIDCPGAFRTRDYVTDPEALDKRYQGILSDWEGEGLRPACESCVHFSCEDVPVDLHIGLVGTKEKEAVIIGVSKRGEELLDEAGIECSEDVSAWQAEVKKVRDRKAGNRIKVFQELKDKAAGMDNLSHLFADCINCHNCMNVCPICYCRQCFFDSSDQVRLRAEDYFAKAQARGGIRFPGDMMQFHLGRIYHMGLSCVGCGACEDGCPMDVPVSQVFALAGDEVQKTFDYVPGRNTEEPIPTLTYEEDELHEYEDAKGSA